MPPASSLATLIIPELPVFPFPPLPPIADPELARLAVTHSSNHALPRRPHALEQDPAEKIEDYEKLEHVGDGLLGAVVTTLLHDLYPQLQPGPATMLKAHLVANTTLAQLCSRYHITDMIVAAPSALYTTRVQVKTRGSVFEAYIAGVFYDFLASDVPGVYTAQAESETTVSGAAATADPESVHGEYVEYVESVASVSSVDVSLGAATNTSTLEDMSTGINGVENKGSEQVQDATSEGDETANGSSEKASPNGTTSVEDKTVETPLGPTREDKTPDSHAEQSHGVISDEDVCNKVADLAIPFASPCFPPPWPEKHLGTPTPRRSRSIRSSSTTEDGPAVPSAYTSAWKLEPLAPLRLRPMRTRGEAYDYIERWLRPLFTPVAHFAFACMEQDLKSLQSIAEDEGGVSAHVTAGSTGALNAWAMKETGRMPSYACSAAGMRWRGSVSVVDKEGVEHSAEAVRDTKKTATTVAAWLVCKQLGLEVDGA